MMQHVLMLLLPFVIAAVPHKVSQKPTTLSAHSVDEQHQKMISDMCQQACGEGVDSSCVPQCQNDMYQCLDANSTTWQHHADYDYAADEQKFSECKEEVMKKYEQFGKDWDETHPYLLAKKVSDAEQKEINGLCVKICGPASSGNCITPCEVEMYQCYDHNRTADAASAKLYEECKEKVVAKYTSSGFFVVKEVSDAKKKEISDICVGICGPSSSGHCITPCQVEMYRCLNHNRTASSEEAEAYEECKEEVILKYTQDGALFFAAKKVSAAEKKSIGDECENLCGSAVDSSCTTSCEVEMYQCYDHNKTADLESAHAYAACKENVEAKYSAFGHSLFMAKTVSAAEKKEISDKCKQLCGASADSSCETSCEVEMYQCLDHNRTAGLPSAELYKKCTETVKAKYGDFEDDWDKTHGFFSKGDHDKSVSKGLDKVINSACEEACGDHVDSHCAIQCKNEMYWCVENMNHPSGPSINEACKEETMKKFSKNKEAGSAFLSKHH